MNRFVFFLCLSAFPCVLFGQNVSARVAGLENDQKYMELLGKEQQLHRMEDSVVRIIGDTRELVLFALGRPTSERSTGPKSCVWKRNCMKFAIVSV